MFNQKSAYSFLTKEYSHTTVYYTLIKAIIQRLKYTSTALLYQNIVSVYKVSNLRILRVTYT